MDVFAYLIGGFGVGFGFGAVFSYLFLKGKLSSVEVIKKEKEFAEQENSRLKEECEKSNQEFNEIKENSGKMLDELNKIREEKTELEKQLAQANGKIETLDDAKKLMDDIKKEMKTEYQNISHETINKQGEINRKNIEENLQKLLNPFKDDIKNCKTALDEVNLKTKTEIKSKIDDMLKQTLEIGGKADRLASAFEGDKKGQGNFGELKFEELLNWYGFKEGENYYKQYLVKDVQKNKFPDFILQAQPNKWLVIDSKFSFGAYEKYVHENDKNLKEKYLDEYVSNLKDRIKELGEKEYHKLLKQNGKDTFGFTCLFFGNEMAYLSAISDIKYRKELEGLSRKYEVAILTASSFSPILQMIQQLWSIGKTNDNIIKAKEIIEKWLVKIADFDENIENVGKAISKAQNDYDEAVKKLRGTGNANNLANKVVKLVDAKLKPKDGKERIIRDNLFLSNENNNAEE